MGMIPCSLVERHLHGVGSQNTVISIVTAVRGEEASRHLGEGAINLFSYESIKNIYKHSVLS
jgi:hypothetical protein